MAEQTAEALFDALDAQGPSETLPAHEARAAAKEEREGLTDALGTAPRLLDVVLAPCTAVDADHHRATFDCGLRGSVAAYYWPTAPAVGDTWPVRFASEHLEPWTRTNTTGATRLWVYWLGELTAGVAALYRAVWPPADVPTLEHVADIPVAAEIDRAYLVGLDGQGTVYLALDQFGSGDGRSYTQRIPDWGRGTPAGRIHVPWVDPAGADHIGDPGAGTVLLITLLPIALATTTTGAGVLVGSLTLYDPLPANPPHTALSPSYRRYFRSDDGGSTWAEFARHLQEVDTWNNPGVDGGILRTLYYSPGPTTWATVLEDGEPAHAAPAGTLALRQSLYRHDTTPFVSGPGGAKIGFGIADETGAILTIDLDGGAFTDANLALAGITPTRLREILSWQADFGDTLTYRSDVDAATPWELLDVTSQPPSTPFGFTRDRALAHGIGIDADNFFVYTTDGGDTWQRFSDDQANLRDALAFAGILTGTALIVDAPE